MPASDAPSSGLCRAWWHREGSVREYFIYENGSAVAQEVNSLPPEVEEIYAHARQKYIIDFERDDWADDDTDWGSGYDYDNSYHVLREPLRRELVIRDGSLYGFRVYEDKVLVPGECTNARAGYIRKRFGDMYTWNLVEEETPKPADHVCLLRCASSSDDHVFVSEDFPEGLVESVVEKTNLQDSRGWFDGHARVLLKLTPRAAANPDETLAAFADFNPTLVKVR